MNVAPLKPYLFIDYATQGYLAVVGLIILLLHGEAVPYWPLLVTVHAALLLLVHWLIHYAARHPRNGTVDFLRHFYPILLYTGFFRETGELNQMLITGFVDPWFIQLDERLFGGQPSLVFMDWLPYLLVSELFYASYFSYYVMIAGVGLALFFRNRVYFHHYVSLVSFVFYLCYLTYIFLPVMGPRIFFKEISGYDLPAAVQPAVPPDFPAAVQAGPFYQIMAFLYEHFESPGSAFPSSHVAVAICTLFFTCRYLRRLRYLHLVAVVLLCLSTVYCRYHYVVDVFAGVITAAVLIPVGNRLYFRFQGKERQDGMDLAVLAADAGQFAKPDE